MWVRGLKPSGADSRALIGVAPYVGAWIETCCCANICDIKFVAPYVGAWIETRRRSRTTAESMSHPMWVRGLKLLYL